VSDRCACCDLPSYSCGAEKERQRLGQERAERARLLALPGVIEARYAGPCEGCGEWFKPGDPIRRDDRAGSWRCLLCCGSPQPKPSWPGAMP